MDIWHNHSSCTNVIFIQFLMYLHYTVRPLTTCAPFLRTSHIPAFHSGHAFMGLLFPRFFNLWCNSPLGIHGALHLAASDCQGASDNRDCSGKISVRECLKLYSPLAVYHAARSQASMYWGWNPASCRKATLNRPDSLQFAGWPVNCNRSWPSFF